MSAADEYTPMPGREIVASLASRLHHLHPGDNTTREVLDEFDRWLARPVTDAVLDKALSTWERQYQARVREFNDSRGGGISASAVRKAVRAAMRDTLSAALEAREEADRV